MQKIEQILLLLLCILLCACHSSKRMNTKFNYFQKGLDSSRLISFKPLIIQPNDNLSIYVSSNTINQEQAVIFNVFNNGGNTLTNGTNQTATPTSGYLVDQNGYIRFPMLGMVKAAGLTRTEFSDYLQEQLSSKALVMEPIVQVRFLQIKINVLGEVKSPGTKIFTSDRITIIDALGAAGDLSDMGRRDNIKLIREEQGDQKVYTVNLLDAGFMSQEGYQLQQNDIVYVYANNTKLKEIKYNPNVSRDLGVTTSILSTLSFVVSLFILFKN